MFFDKNETINKILQQLYEETGRKHDAHYKEGKGVLIVPLNYDLKPENVVLIIDEMQLQMLSMPNAKIDIRI